MVSRYSDSTKSSIRAPSRLMDPATRGASIFTRGTSRGTAATVGTATWPGAAAGAPAGALPLVCTAVGCPAGRCAVGAGFFVGMKA